MVAAILLQKKRLVDILEEACDLDPLNAAGDLADAPGASSSTTPPLTSSNALDNFTSYSPASSNPKRRRNSLASRADACARSRDANLYMSPSFNSDSASTDSSTAQLSSGTSSKVRFSTSPPQVRYFSNYMPSMTEKEREQVRTCIWYTVRRCRELYTE